MNLNQRPLHFEIISGSTRPNGNTEQVSEHIVGLLKAYDCTADVIRLREYNIKPCGTCGECNVRTASCGINDDMQSIVARMTAADGLIYAVPVHGYGMAHPMQGFIERAGVGYLRFARPLANKVAGAVVTGRRYGHVSVYNQLVNNILLNRMILVGSGYPAVLFGGRPGGALQDVEGMEAVRSLISRMISMAHLLRTASQDAIAGLLAPDTPNERVLKLAKSAAS